MVSMKLNKKSIFALGIFICFLICLSHVSACEGVDNSTSVVSVVDNSPSSDYNVPHSDVSDVSNSDLTNMSQDKQLSPILMSSTSSHDKLGKRHDDKKEVKDNIIVGNFSLLNKELSDFNDNRYYRIVEYGHNHEIHKIADPSQFDKVHTFNLTRDYVYDDSTDKEFINGIPLLASANRELYRNLTINGNGHFIDGKGLACIFGVFGSNVQICNITFKNLNTIHAYYHEEVFGSRYPYLGRGSDSIKSPIVWLGNNGKLINCTFLDNTGSLGGSVFWQGNNGIIEHNKFINNKAAFLGGFAYIEGLNNIIHDNLVVNCEAMLDGDALYVKNLTANSVGQMNYIKVNKTNSTFVCPDVVDGSLMKVSSSALRTDYVSLDYELVDITPLVYGSLFYGRNYFTLDKGINVYTSYDSAEHVLTLTLSRFSSPTLEMRKILNIQILERDLSNTFNRLISANGVFQIIKHYTVNNADDYKKANGLKASTVISEYNALKKLELGNETYNFDTITPILDVKFNKTLSIDSSLTWTPNGFDVIYIDGANSHIFTENDQRAEKKFVDWEEDSLFVASNLRVSGFNNAFKNIGSQMLLRNVEIFGNKMDYIVDRDYGAGILNTGVVYCMNCTFHDNKAKYGGAIYNQGLLVVTDSSFYSNNGYKKGSDIVNVDDGIVTIDGKNYKACDGDKLVYMKSMSSEWQTVVKVVCYGGAFVLGAVAGFLTANPLIGIGVGAAVGAAVGSIGSAVICSNVYDINFCRWSCALTLIVGSAGAGAIGGGLGGIAGAYSAANSCANTVISVHNAYSEFAGLSSDVIVGSGVSPVVAQQSAMAGAQASYNVLCAAFTSYQASLATISTSFIVSSTAIVGILAAEMTAGAIFVPGALWTPTTHYTNPDPDDMYSLIPFNSNTYVLSSDLVSSIKSDNNIQKINDLFDKSNNEITFTADEVLAAISSINLNNGQVHSVLY